MTSIDETTTQASSTTTRSSKAGPVPGVAPGARREPRPAPSATTQSPGQTWTTDPAMEDPTAAAWDPLSDPVVDAGSSASASRSTTARSTPTNEQVGAIASMIAVAVGLAGKLLHSWRTPGDNSVWIPSETDLEAICTPAARLASRHMPAGGLEGSADAADVAELVGGAHEY